MSKAVIATMMYKLQGTHTYTDIAKDLDVSTTTVICMFTKTFHFGIPEYLTATLAIDELRKLKYWNGIAMVFVISVDLELGCWWFCLVSTTSLIYLYLSLYRLLTILYDSRLPTKKKHKWGYFVVPKISYIHCISLMFLCISLYLYFYTVLMWKKLNRLIAVPKNWHRAVINSTIL